MKAVAARQYGYDSHGMSGHQIYAAPMVVRDPQVRAQTTPKNR